MRGKENLIRKVYVFGCEMQEGGRGKFAIMKCNEKLILNIGER